MKKITTTIILLAIPALVLAGPGKMMKNKPMQKTRAAVCDQLNLTEQQQEQMHALRIKHQKAMIPVQSDLKLAKLELDELIRDGETSKKLDTAIKKVNNLRAKQFEMQVKHRIETGKILTEEQRAIMQKCKRSRGMEYRHDRERGKHCGMKGGGHRMPVMPEGLEAE